MFKFEREREVDRETETEADRETETDKAVKVFALLEFDREEYNAFFVHITPTQKIKFECTENGL